MPISDDDTASDAITGYAFQGGGASSGVAGRYWGGYFERAQAEGMETPIYLGAGETSLYQVLELSFAGSCGPPPAGDFSVSVIIDLD